MHLILNDVWDIRNREMHPILNDVWNVRYGEMQLILNDAWDIRNREMHPILNDASITSVGCQHFPFEKMQSHRNIFSMFLNIHQPIGYPVLYILVNLTN